MAAEMQTQHSFQSEPGQNDLQDFTQSRFTLAESSSESQFNLVTRAFEAAKQGAEHRYKLKENVSR